MSVKLPNTETGTQRREREIFIAKWGWQRFNQLFPDEAACVDELNRRASGTAMCLCCYKSGWHTSGISFAQTKKLRPWFAALWLYEQGVKMSVCQFADFANVARPTASLMLQSVAQLAEQLAFATTDASATLATAQNLIKLSEYTPIQKRRTTSNMSVKDVAKQDGLAQKHCADLNADKNENSDIARASVDSKGEKAEQITPEKARNEDLEVVKQNLLTLLTYEPLTLDQLQDRIDAPGHLVTAATMLLELERAINGTSNNQYVIAGQQKRDSSARKSADAQKAKVSKQTTPTKSTLEIIKSAMKDVAKALFHEISQFFGVCKNCIQKLQQKKI